MKWLMSVVMTGIATALEQYSWGLLAAYGYDLDATQEAIGEASEDARRADAREVDIALIVCQGHL